MKVLVLRLAHFHMLVHSRIKTIITSKTGVSAARTFNAEESAADDAIVYTSAAVEFNSNGITLNERGWITGADNKRINIYADSESTLLIDGIAATEENERVFDKHGVRVGSVWELGSTGKKIYALYDGEYEISGTGIVKIEYMDNGYFESAVEYDSGVDLMSINTTGTRRRASIISAVVVIWL